MYFLTYDCVDLGTMDKNSVGEQKTPFTDRLFNLIGTMPFHCNAILVHVNVLSLILVGTLYSHDHCRHGRQWCRGFWRVLVRYGYVLHVHEGRDYALLLRVLRCRSVRLYKPLWFSIKHLAMRTLHFSLPLSFLFWHFIFLKLASQIIVMMIIRAS